ncbi:MAG: hypothetical protein PF481_01170 [Bacteroidales bacterium]|jgi:formiminoglutamase|nr:hypothetical protein [Bacteroidales bacterium]
MTLSDCLTNVHDYKISERDSFENQIINFTSLSQLNECDVFLLGNTEDRLAEQRLFSEASQAIRTRFQHLTSVDKTITILDLGDIVRGKTYQDTRIAIHVIMSALLPYDKPIVVFGGSHDVFVDLAQDILAQQTFPSVSVFDATIDYDTDCSIRHNHNFLSSFCNFDSQVRINHLAHQSYLTSKISLKWMDEHYFSHYRLAELKNILDVEPVIRDSHCVSFDMSAVRFCDSPASVLCLPAGVTAHQACEIGWMTGLSDNTKLFFLSEYTFENDIKNVSAMLAAQIMWHIIDGVSQRKGDSICEENLDGFARYYIKSEYLNQDLVFYQSKRTHKMWVEIPTGTHAKRYLPCSSKEYENALQNEILEEWFNEFNRLYKTI